MGNFELKKTWNDVISRHLTFNYVKWRHLTKKTSTTVNSFPIVSFSSKDKNAENIEEANKKFLEIQDAYETLTDDQERAWYDSHREVLLNGGLNPDNKDNTIYVFNVYPYFTSSCFKGYNDDEKVRNATILKRNIIKTIFILSLILNNINRVSILFIEKFLGKLLMKIKIAMKKTLKYQTLEHQLVTTNQYYNIFIKTLL